MNLHPKQLPGFGTRRRLLSLHPFVPVFSERRLVFPWQPPVLLLPGMFLHSRARPWLYLLQYPEFESDHQRRLWWALRRSRVLFQIMNLPCWYPRQAVPPENRTRFSLLRCNWLHCWRPSASRSVSTRVSHFDHAFQWLQIETHPEQSLPWLRYLHR